MLHLAEVDVVVIAFYLAGYLVLGLYKSKYIKDNEIFHIHISEKSFYNIIVSSAVFTICVGGMLATASKAYALGMIFVIPRILSPLFLFSIIKIYTSNTGLLKDTLSISEIMESLYGKVGKLVTNASTILVSIGVIASQGAVIGHLFYYFLNIPYSIGAILSILTLIMHSLFFKNIQALKFSYIVQFGIFAISIPIICILIYNDIGVEAVKNTSTQLFDLNLENYNSVFFFLGLILYGMLPITEGIATHGSLNIKNLKQLSKAIKLSTIVNLVLVIIICLSSFFIQIKEQNLDHNYVFMDFISRYMFTGFRGILIAAILTTTISISNSWMSVASTLCLDSLSRSIRYELSHFNKRNIILLSTFIIGLFAIFIIILKNDIMEIMWMTANFWQPLIFIPLIAGLLKFKTNPKAFYCAVITSLIFTLGGFYLEGTLSIISLFYGVCGSVLGLFSAHYFILYKPNIHSVIVKILEILNIQRIAVRNLCSKLITVSSFFLKSESKHVTANNYIFSIFLIINYLIPLFVVSISGDLIHDSVIYLRIIAIIVCIPLIFIEYWPYSLRKKYYYAYWYCSLLFCLPFIASYTVLVTHVSEFWLLNAVLSLLLLFMLLDWVKFVLTVSMGFVLGILSYSIALYRSYAVQVPSHDILLLLYIYIFMLMLMILFVRRKENAQRQKVENIQLFGGAIAHEVNTPVANTQMLASTLAEIMKSAEVSEEKLGTDTSYVVRFSATDYDMISKFIPTNLIRTTNEAKKVVDILLLLLKHQIPETKSKYSMYQIVKEVVDEYSIEEEKKALITISSQCDFIFYGHKQYIKQIIINLLNNSFKYAGDNFTIHIWMREHCLHFRDTGKGIDPKYKDYLFKAFYSKSKVGNGIGLAFCKILIHGMGGEIECKSEVGKFTEFILTLPEE